MLLGNLWLKLRASLHDGAAPSGHPPCAQPRWTSLSLRCITQVRNGVRKVNGEHRSARWATLGSHHHRGRRCSRPCPVVCYCFSGQCACQPAFTMALLACRPATHPWLVPAPAPSRSATARTAAGCPPATRASTRCCCRRTAPRRSWPTACAWPSSTLRDLGWNELSRRGGARRGAVQSARLGVRIGAPSAGTN